MLNVPLVWTEVQDSDSVYHRKNLWLLAPGTLLSQEGEHAEARIWSNNCRASRALPLKKPTTYRILLLGCSCTSGVGVVDQDTYAWKLNEILPDVEFDNVGVGGNGALRSLVRMREMLPEKRYDLVIYAMLKDHCDRETSPVLRTNYQESEYCTQPEPRACQNVYILPYTWLDSSYSFSNKYLSRFRIWGEDFIPLFALLGRYATVTYAILHQATSIEQRITAHSRQVSAMFQESAMFGCPFLLVTLDGFDYYMPYEKIFSKQYQKIDVTFPLPLTAEYRVGNLECNHPKGIVHTHYAHAIADYLNAHRELLTHRQTCGHRTMYDLDQQISPK